MLSDYRPSFRFVFAGTVALVALTATLATCLVVGQQMSVRMRRDIVADLRTTAKQMSGILERGMAARVRDMTVIAATETMRDPTRDPVVKRRILQQLMITYPSYAALMYIGLDGKIVASTTPALEGDDVSARAYFIQGRDRPFVGDVHDAVLMSRYLRGFSAEVPRLVDISAPVRDEQGNLIGVVASHLQWTWAKDVEAVMREAAGESRRTLDFFVLAADGSILLGPGEAVPSGQEDSSRPVVETWPDGKKYLVARHKSRPYRDFPGLGWSIVTRQASSDAFAPVRDMQVTIALAGFTVSVGAAVLAWLAAGAALRPLRTITASTVSLGRGDLSVPVPVSRILEISELAAALHATSKQLNARSSEQEALIGELNHRVRNTLTIIQSITNLSAKTYSSVSDFARRLQDRLHAIASTHDVLTSHSWKGVDLASVVVQATLDPHGKRDKRVRIDGPRVPVTPQAAVMIGLAFSELVSNALAFGALSVPDGRVEVRWTAMPEEDGSRRVHLVWEERGGPAVVETPRKGLGSVLLEQLASVGSGGAATLEFSRSGFRCSLVMLLHPPKEGLFLAGGRQAA